MGGVSLKLDATNDQLVRESCIKYAARVAWIEHQIRTRFQAAGLIQTNTTGSP
jgi:hypothetical protein